MEYGYGGLRHSHCGSALARAGGNQGWHPREHRCGRGGRKVGPGRSGSRSEPRGADRQHHRLYRRLAHLRDERRIRGLVHLHRLTRSSHNLVQRIRPRPARHDRFHHGQGGGISRRQGQGRHRLLQRNNAPSEAGLEHGHPGAGDPPSRTPLARPAGVYGRHAHEHRRGRSHRDAQPGGRQPGSGRQPGHQSVRAERPALRVRRWLDRHLVQQRLRQELPLRRLSRVRHRRVQRHLPRLDR